MLILIHLENDDDWLEIKDLTSSRNLLPNIRIMLPQHFNFNWPLKNKVFFLYIYINTLHLIFIYFSKVWRLKKKEIRGKVVGPIQGFYSVSIIIIFSSDDFSNILGGLMKCSVNL